MNFFSIMVAGLLAVAAAMWSNLDYLGEKLAGEKPPHCLPPYEVAWLPWEPGLVEAKRAEGELVWLNFTAQWSATVLVMENRVFSDEEVVQKLSENRVVLIKADMTDRNQLMHEELQKYGRQTIPTNIIFSADPEEKMIILPELLTPEIAIEGLDKAAGK